MSLSLRFACRKGSPVLGREPARNVRNFEQSVKNKLGYFVQNFTNSSMSIIQWSASVATFFQSSQRFIRENCSNLFVQFIAGRPTGPHLSISAAWMHRGPAPKQAIGVTMASKIFSLFLMDTFRLRNIDLLAKKARFADCK